MIKMMKNLVLFFVFLSVDLFVSTKSFPIKDNGCHEHIPQTPPAPKWSRNIIPQISSPQPPPPEEYSNHFDPPRWSRNIIPPTSPPPSTTEPFNRFDPLRWSGRNIPQPSPPPPSPNRFQNDRNIPINFDGPRWPRDINPWFNPRALSTCDRNPNVCRVWGSFRPDCCGKFCVNLKFDFLNCGECGKRCKFGEVCCGGSCASLLFDSNHCGMCNNKCGEGGSCTYGMCSYAGV